MGVDAAFFLVSVQGQWDQDRLWHFELDGAAMQA